MPVTQQSIDVDSSIEEVWFRFRNFHDMSWAPNVISSVEKVGDVEGDKAGAQRILNDAFHETLVEINHDQYHLKYSIDDGPSPVSRQEVSNYYGVVRLTPSGQGQGTHVEWSSSWDANVDDAVDFCHGIYVALLAELKKSFG